MISPYQNVHGILREDIGGIPGYLHNWNPTGTGSGCEVRHTRQKSNIAMGIANASSQASREKSTRTYQNTIGPLGTCFAGTFSEVDFIGFFAHTVVNLNAIIYYILDDSNRRIQSHNVSNKV